MNNQNYRKKIWTLIITVITTIVCLVSIYLYYSDSNAPSHHIHHDKVTKVSNSRRTPSIHLLTYNRLYFNLKHPSLTRKYYKDNKATLIHYGFKRNLNVSQYRNLYNLSSWYDLKSHQKYHVKFSYHLLKMLKSDLLLKMSQNKRKQQLNRSIPGKIRQQVLIDINNVRARYHIAPYHMDNSLQRLANIRAPQANNAYLSEPHVFETEKMRGRDNNSDKWIHGIDKHQTNIDDAKQYHIKLNVRPGRYVHNGMLDENAAPLYLGKNYVLDTHYYSIENNKNIKSLAWNCVHNMVYHDNFAHNGHRNAILNRHQSLIGIGVYFNKYSHHHQKGTIVEEID